MDMCTFELPRNSAERQTEPDTTKLVKCKIWSRTEENQNFEILLSPTKKENFSVSSTSPQMITKVLYSPKGHMRVLRAEQCKLGKRRWASDWSPPLTRYPISPHLIWCHCNSSHPLRILTWEKQKKKVAPAVTMMELQKCAIKTEGGH